MRWGALILAIGCAKAPPAPRTCAAVPAAEGLRKAGHGLLPSGREIQPSGESLQIGQNPQRIALNADGSLLAAAEFGVNLRGLSVASLGPTLQLAAQPVQSRSGGYRSVQFAPDGTLWALNTGEKRIEAWGTGFADHRDIAITGDWPADFVLSNGTLWVAAALSNRVEKYDAASGALLKQAASGGIYPQALLLDQDRIYVANEGAAPGKKNRVAVLDANTLAQVASYEVGKNPAALALDSRSQILYVAASDDDWIDRIDLRSQGLLTAIPLAQPGREAHAYEGLAVSPTALALSEDGARLYVSAALLNAILVVDTGAAAQIGAIPAGDRPNAVVASGGTLFVANSKGNGTTPGAPLDPDATWAPDNSDLPRGTVERIDLTTLDLAAATLRVEALDAPVEFEKPDPACARIGPLPATRDADPQLSQIKHVIYVLKENKTFDSVFGDFPGADASRDALEWGDEITPNQHELAHQFCLLDNFYVESEQSVEGHFWATAQVTTDYFERTWGAPWGGHVKTPQPLPPTGLSPIDSPRGGFIFDLFARARIPYTSYGEFVGTSGDLAAHIDQRFVDFPTNFLARPDTEKLKVFTDAVAAGKLQPFTFVALQYDHTFGFAPGQPDPFYMIADNDRATGLLVDAISHSPYWGD
ncbi:MAG: bifunctional YncE family protein/alkaline phosphatase family protein, partial [Myxococcales bacterium]